MKTALTILLIVMVFLTIVSACQYDIVNASIAMASLPILLLGLVHPKIKDKL